MFVVSYNCDVASGPAVIDPSEGGGREGGDESPQRGGDTLYTRLADPYYKAHFHNFHGLSRIHACVIVATAGASVFDCPSSFLNPALRRYKTHPHFDGSGCLGICPDYSRCYYHFH